MAPRGCRALVWGALCLGLAAWQGGRPGAEAVAALVWEAEDCTCMLPPVAVEAADGASAGLCLTVPTGLRSQGSEARYRVRVPDDGAYVPWFRVLSTFAWDGWGRLRVDDAFVGPWIITAVNPAWQWTRGIYDQQGLPYPGSPTIELRAGTRVLALGAPGACADGIARTYGKLDKILLTRDDSYVPTDGDPATRNMEPSLVLRQEDPAGLVVWEAEDLAPGAAAARIEEVAGAHAGSAVSSVEGAAGLAGYRVDVANAGEYALWARVRFTRPPDAKAAPTLRVKVGGAGLTLAGYRGWGDGYFAWVRDAEVEPHAPFHGVTVPVALQLPAGESRLVLDSLGKGTAVDQFALSPTPDWIPGADGRRAIDDAGPGVE